MAGGDYNRFKHFYTNKTTNSDLATGDAGKAGVITAKSASHQIFVQKITWNPVTVAAQVVLIRDSAGTPVVIATVPASQATPIVFDFGPEGVPLTVGKNLDFSNTAGPAAKVHVEAYEKLGATINYLAGASSQ